MLSVLDKEQNIFLYITFLSITEMHAIPFTNK